MRPVMALMSSTAVARSMPDGMRVAGVQDEARRRIRPPRPRAGRSPPGVWPSPCRRRRCSRSGSAAGTRPPPAWRAKALRQLSNPTAGSASAVHMPAVHDQPLGVHRGRGPCVGDEQLAARDADPVVRGRDVDDVRERARTRRVRRLRSSAACGCAFGCFPALRIGEEDLHPVGARLSGFADGIGVVFAGADMDAECGHRWHSHGAEGSGEARHPGKFGLRARKLILTVRIVWELSGALGGHFGPGCRCPVPPSLQ